VCVSAEVGAAFPTRGVLLLREKGCVPYSGCAFAKEEIMCAEACDLRQRS
jgi:hypothetical protein